MMERLLGTGSSAPAPVLAAADGAVGCESSETRGS